MVTTFEEGPWKAHVEPYADAPKVRVAKGVIACYFCANTGFRRSRVRFPDLGELLLLRYPLRCMRCNQRQYAYFLTAGLALPPKTQSTRIARGQETWQAWTGRQPDGSPGQTELVHSATDQAQH